MTFREKVEGILREFEGVFANTRAEDIIDEELKAHRGRYADKILSLLPSEITREVVITSGGDWADASFQIFDLPKDMDLDKEKELCYERNKSSGGKHIFLEDMIIEHGAKIREVESYED